MWILRSIINSTPGILSLFQSTVQTASNTDMNCNLIAGVNTIDKSELNEQHRAYTKLELSIAKELQGLIKSIVSEQSNTLNIFEDIKKEKVALRTLVNGLKQKKAFMREKTNEYTRERKSLPEDIRKIKSDTLGSIKFDISNLNFCIREKITVNQQSINKLSNSINDVRKTTSKSFEYINKVQKVTFPGLRVTSVSNGIVQSKARLSVVELYIRQCVRQRILISCETAKRIIEELVNVYNNFFNALSEREKVKTLFINAQKTRKSHTREVKIKGNDLRKELFQRLYAKKIQDGSFDANMNERIDTLRKSVCDANVAIDNARVAIDNAIEKANCDADKLVEQSQMQE